MKHFIELSEADFAALETKKHLVLKTQRKISAFDEITFENGEQQEHKTIYEVYKEPGMKQDYTLVFFREEEA